MKLRIAMSGMGMAIRQDIFGAEGSTTFER
jgi:hypothetical protein